MINVNEAKKEFIDIYTQLITREGSKELLEFLEKTDFFIAPASTQFHSNCEGGLASHSVNVFKRFRNMIQLEFGDNYKERVSEETIAICGLLHDLCKVDTFKLDVRNKRWMGIGYRYHVIQLKTISHMGMVRNLFT